jgi:hypothetical protein
LPGRENQLTVEVKVAPKSNRGFRAPGWASNPSRRKNLKAKNPGVEKAGLSKQRNYLAPGTLETIIFHMFV